MPDKEITKKVNKEKVVGGANSYNPDKEVEDKEYTSPVKIGDKEYVVKPLSMLDIKRLNIEKKKVKPEDDIATYDFSFQTLLTVIQKFNPETKHLSIEQFEDMIDITEFERIQAAILQISGLKKFFQPGVSKK